MEYGSLEAINRPLGPMGQEELREFNKLLESFKKLSITIYNFISCLKRNRFRGQEYRKQYRSMRLEVTEMLKHLLKR